MATVAHPRALPPMPAVARILSQFDRPQLASFIEVAISLIDQEDGDPDLELTGAEDDFMDHRADGPGCPISDASEADDFGEDDDPGGGNVEDEGEIEDGR